ncbi:helix-turn-helix transcriptional regulator [Shewanella sp. WXL01]|uniref:helix-turn-helix domain-containing protein n=1 Tax=Shewanella sp. WXL01 TaxID=2709721 RepID=UPI00143848D2|nr:helix-turn-helix transcriptional regulator [Shewanella sp. WXL01]NKF51385.1 helix-turn-helix transcriptional regulator [Shewanella sp. WXL01]
MNTFFERLKSERVRLGLSQTEFAERCGVKKLSQSNYETGKRKPDIEYLALARQLGCDTEYVISGMRSDTDDFDFYLQEQAIETVAKFIHRSGRTLAHPERVYPVAMEIYQMLKKAKDEQQELDSVELGAKVIKLFAA